MEKPAAGRTMSKIFSFLPKGASVTFQNPPFSPGRENNKLKSHINKGFSGPIISIIPAEARRKSKNDASFDSSQEPTSPKISCMGQIKHKKKCKSNCVLPKTTQKEDHHQEKNKKDKKNEKPPKSSKLQKPSSSSSSSSAVISREDSKKLDSRVYNNNKPSISSSYAEAPSLDQMKRFTSGRDTLANFDWKANYGFDDEEDYEKEEDEVFIAHSAPLTMGGGGERINALKGCNSKKEINLWKRRTMAPPRPLQINLTTN